MENRITLDELAIQHQTDKATIYQGPSVHGYAPIYDKYLSPLRDKPIRMLEIGVCMEFSAGGQSIRMWNDYFTQAEIYTFDIVDMSTHPCIVENNNVFFYRGDQSQRKDFVSMYKAFGSKKFDFILEDGSHVHEHQMISFGHMFNYVKSGGYYILEDMSIPNHPCCCIRNDDTYRIIEAFKNTGIIDSNYISSEEKAYIEKNVKSVEIFADVQDAYATAIITKK